MKFRRLPRNFVNMISQNISPFLVSDAERSYNRSVLLLKQSNLDQDKQDKWKSGRIFFLQFFFGGGGRPNLVEGKSRLAKIIFSSSPNLKMSKLKWQIVINILRSYVWRQCVIEELQVLKTC